MELMPNSPGLMTEEPALQLPDEIHLKLLEPAIWQNSLKTYGRTTNLAVALTDTTGHVIGDIVNTQSIWRVLKKGEECHESACPFSLPPLENCDCVADALANSNLVFARSQTGLVHFALPLQLGGQNLAALVAGQVFDQYPEQLAIERAAKKLGVSPGQAWITARLEHPVKRLTLKIYGELLETMGNTLLLTSYHSIMEATTLTEMTRLRDLANEASRMKDEFLATVSHELRTPLNAIIGWTRMLHAGEMKEDAANRALETIYRCAKSQAQLIEDLLDVSRIITGKMRFDARPVHLDSVIQAAIDSIRPAIRSKAIHLLTSFSPDVGQVLGDPERLQQIVWNLLSNAVKFTPNGGEIKVDLESVDGAAQITVRDSGIGISADFLPYIFERFRQFDGTSTRKHGGLGLGLAIVRHFVELHGGTVQATSDGEGSGTIFTIRLPLVTLPFVEENQPRTRLEIAAVTGGQFECPPQIEGLRVLLVDDDVDTLAMLETAFGRCGAVIRISSSASDAFEILQHWKPDVLVSDIAMPAEDGYSLIKKIRAMSPEQGGDIPAVALTAYARVEDRTEVLSAGFQMFVAKPVDPLELLAIIASLFGEN